MPPNPSWKKGGASPNPSGRPPMRALFEKLGLGANCEVLFTQLKNIALGTLPDPANPGAMLAIPVKLRADVTEYLISRRFGAVPTSATLELSGSIEHQAPTHRLEVFNNAELADLERLLSKSAVDTLVEGQIVEAEPTVRYDVPTETLIGGTT